jgi:Uma2 family endonuclease
MTVLEDRIEMADADAMSLDDWFERLERMPVPEGYRVEIVGGNVHMTPQRDTHWIIIRRIVRALEDKFGMDVALFKDSAKKDAKGRWRYQDVLFVAEAISQGTAANDYGPKRMAYAEAEVPVYVIADPYQGRCHVYTDPKDGDYADPVKVDFGTDIDLTGTVVDLVLKTDDFPRD